MQPFFLPTMRTGLNRLAQSWHCVHPNTAVRRSLRTWGAALSAAGGGSADVAAAAVATGEQDATADFGFTTVKKEEKEKMGA